MKRFHIRWLSTIKEIRTIEDFKIIGTRHDGDALRLTLRQGGQKVFNHQLPARLSNPGIDIQSPKSRLHVPLQLFGLKNGLLIGNNIPTNQSNGDCIIGHVFNDDNFFYSDKQQIKRHIKKFNSLFKGLNIFENAQIEIDNEMEIEYKEGIFFHLGSPRDKAYSHFIWETLSRLYFFKLLRKTFPDVRLVIHSNYPNWAMDIIKEYGINENDMFIYPYEKNFKCDLLFFGGGVGANNFTAAPEIVDFLKTPCLTDTKWPNNSEGRRVILDRQGNRNNIRSLLNQEELWDIAIKEFSFEKITPEVLSFKEKINLFNECQFVISQYGGGLQTHFLFPPGTKILCLQSETFQRDIIDITAKQLELSVLNLIGPSFYSIIGERNNSDFVIAPELFRNALKRLFN